MFSTLSNDELNEYFALYLIAPFGDVRGDIRNAQVVSVLMRGLLSEDISPAECMPFAHQLDTKANDWRAAKAMMGAIKNARGANKLPKSECLDDPKHG